MPWKRALASPMISVASKAARVEDLMTNTAVPRSVASSSSCHVITRGGEEGNGWARRVTAANATGGRGVTGVTDLRLHRGKEGEGGAEGPRGVVAEDEVPYAEGALARQRGDKEAEEPVGGDKGHGELQVAQMARERGQVQLDELLDHLPRGVPRGVRGRGVHGAVRREVQLDELLSPYTCRSTVWPIIDWT